MQQMDIFDYMQTNIFEFVEAEEKHTDFRFMTDEEIARAIGQAVGLHFEYNDYLCTYEAIVDKVKFDVHTSYYTYDEKKGVPFISCDAMRTYGNFEGRACPEDSLEEAIEFFKNSKKYFLEKEN